MDKTASGLVKFFSLHTLYTEHSKKFIDTEADYKSYVSNPLILENNLSNEYMKIYSTSKSLSSFIFSLSIHCDVINTISICFELNSNLIKKYTKDTNMLVYKLFDKIHLHTESGTSLYKIDSDYVYINSIINNKLSDTETSYCKFIGSDAQKSQWLKENDIITLTIDLPIFKIPIIAIVSDKLLLSVEITPLFEQLRQSPKSPESPDPKSPENSDIYLQTEVLFLDQYLRRKIAASRHEIKNYVFPRKYVFKPFSCTMLDVPYEIAKIIYSYADKVEFAPDSTFLIKYFIIYIKDLQNPQNPQKISDIKKQILNKLCIKYYKCEECLSGYFLNEYLPSKYLPGKLPENMYFYTYAQNPLSENPSGHYNNHSMTSIKFEFDFNILSEYEINIYMMEHNIINIAGGLINLTYIE